MTEFVKRHQLELNAAPSALISVSLAAAGVRQPRGMTLEACVAGLSWETRWSPDEVHHAGGRIRHNGYDYFRGLAVSLIAAARGDEVNIQGDYDLTDYHALDRFILGFARRYAPLPARTKGEGRTVPSVGRLGPDRPES